MILAVESINTFYDKSHILQDVSFEVQQGEAVSLLGRNGVGKTTTLRSIMGLTPPRSGSIAVQEQEVTGLPPFKIAKTGIAYMPDDLRIFPDLTCEENLEIARRLSKRSGYWTRHKVEELFPILGERRRQMGLNMSGGEKKMLSLGRALMANPDLILMDEPSEGLAPLVVNNLVEVIQNIRGQGVTLLMADQNLKFCRRVSDRGYIIEKGRIVHADTIEKIWKDEDVIRKYLVL